MYKLIKFLLFICVFVFTFNSPFDEKFIFQRNCDFSFESELFIEDCFAENEDTIIYAKVLDDCVLFKNEEMNLEFNNVYFQIPESYFIVVLETISETCLKVQYGKYIGFIDATKVEIAKFVPVVKTLENVTFDIKENVGTKIWQYPTTSSNVFTTLSAGTKNIVYIASVSGQIPTGGKSDVWFYVYYTPSFDSTNVYEGYVYSENTTNLSEIVFNNETNPVIISEEMDGNENLIFISTTIKTIVIAVIFIPIILFFAVILFNLIKKLKKNTKYSKNNLKKDSDDIEDFSKQQNIKSIEKYKNLRLVKNKTVSPDFDNFEDDELL